MSEDVNINVRSFKTTDGSQTTQLSPSGTRRQKPNWYIWVKADGQGILVIDSEKKRINLPPNGEIRNPVWCDDSACPLLGPSLHAFGRGCRLYEG
jgi:hypothetical protein